MTDLGGYISFELSIFFFTYHGNAVTGITRILPACRAIVGRVGAKESFVRYHVMETACAAHERLGLMTCVIEHAPHL